MAGRTGERRRARRVPRVLAALAIGAAAAAGIGACSPINTELQYAPSDGNRAELGNDVTVSNLLVLSSAQGEPALIVGGVTNHTADAATVTFTVGGGGDAEPESVDVRVEGASTVLLNPSRDDGVTTVLPASPVPPGANVPVTISTPAAGSTTVNVAVLDGTLAPYDEYLAYLDELD